MTRALAAHRPLSAMVFLCLSDWLLLQTPQLVFLEGETIMLKCHSWKNKQLNRISFFQNGKSVRFHHHSNNFSIPKANHSHNGDYYCKGNLGKAEYTSKPVTIIVQGMWTLSRCWKRRRDKQRLKSYSSTWRSRSSTAAKLGCEAKRRAMQAWPSAGQVPQLQAVGDKAVGKQSLVVGT